MFRISAFTGLVIVTATMTSLAAAQPVPEAEEQARSSKACTAPGYRQFDFWVGEWEVTPNGTDKIVAHSLIESLYGGCAIRENWMPLTREDGGSLNSFLPALGVWRQIWTDSQGSWNVFEGGRVGDAMVLLGHRLGNDPKDSAILARMTFTPLEDGSVRQHGEHSSDFGQTWQTSYDFIYRKRNSPDDD